MNGYALVNQKNEAFSWHATLAQAVERAAWEFKYGCGQFRIVKDTEATWPEIIS